MPNEKKERKRRRNENILAGVFSRKLFLVKEPLKRKKDKYERFRRRHSNEFRRRHSNEVYYF